MLHGVLLVLWCQGIGLVVSAGLAEDERENQTEDGQRLGEGEAKDGDALSMPRASGWRATPLMYAAKIRPMPTPGPIADRP